MTDIDMLLTIKKGIRGELCNLFTNMRKVIIKTMIRVKNHSILSWNVENLYGWAMLQKLIVDGFENVDWKWISIY